MTQHDYKSVADSLPKTLGMKNEAVLASWLLINRHAIRHALLLADKMMQEPVYSLAQIEAVLTSLYYSGDPDVPPAGDAYEEPYRAALDDVRQSLANLGPMRDQMIKEVGGMIEDHVPKGWQILSVKWGLPAEDKTSPDENGYVCTLFYTGPAWATKHPKNTTVVGFGNSIEEAVCVAVTCLPEAQP